MKIATSRIRRFGTTALCVALGGVAGCGAPDATSAEVGSPGDAPLLAAPDEEYVPTPSGRFHRSCVQEVEEGAVVDAAGNIVRDGEIIEGARPCAYEQKPLLRPAGFPPLSGGGGWLERIQTPAPPNPFGGRQEFTLLSADIRVPQKPKTNSDQLLYVFPGLAPFIGDYILQPVLQYGVGAPTGGGYQWELVSYFVRNGRAFFGARRAAVPGETVATSIFIHHTFTSPEGTFRQWNVKGTAASGTSLLAVNVNIESFTSTAYGAALEGYRINKCDELPNELGILFSNVRLFMPSPQGLRQLLEPVWYPEVTLDPAQCGLNALVRSPTSLRLNVRRP